jgi:hypothetical protein
LTDPVEKLQQQIHAEEAPGEHYYLMMRPYEPEADEALVMDNWMKHIRKLPPFDAFRKLDMDLHREVVTAAIERCRPVMAVSQDNDRQVLGWICSEHRPHPRPLVTSAGLPVLHMIYVRNTYRQMGIGTTLMQVSFPGFKKQTVYCTHPGRAFRHLRKKWMLTFNPYLVN